jgi:hypothetical protein
VRNACRTIVRDTPKKRAERNFLQFGTRRQPPLEDRGANGIADARFRARLACGFPLAFRHDGASIGPDIGPGQYHPGYPILKSCIQE